MKQQLEDICRRYEVADLYVFGSRSQEVSSLLSGSAEPPLPPGSDVDIGIRPATLEAWNPRKRVQLTQELEDLLQVHLVHLVLLPEADPFLALDIIRGELLYAQDLDDQARYELFVLRRAGDLMPYKKERIRMILEEGAR
jgi:predicted nucleotidyltransferase